MAKRISTEHVDEFFRRERQELFQLEAEIGREAVGKMDSILLRDILHERRSVAMNAMFGYSAQPAQHSVVVSLRSGRWDPSGVIRIPKESERREFVATARRSAKLALSRLEPDLQERGVEIRERFWISHSVVIDVSLEDLASIASRHDVVSVTSNKERLIACLDSSRTLIGADQVQNAGNTGAGIVVAIIDTGVDINHPALAGVVTSQQDFTGSGGGTAEGIGDMVGHGTHCAGIVASQDATFHGIAPGASLLDIKIMRNNGAGGGVGTPASAIAGITAAVTANARVASCSWGFSHANGNWVDTSDTCVICTAVNNAVTSGVIFAIAAGNEDNDTCSTYDTHIDCPGNARNAITVAASDKSDHMAGFSSIGPTVDGRAKPDITAPGVDIGSCRASGTSLGRPIDANFTRADGTSMATPHIAGVAALVLARSPGLTPANVIGILMSTAVNIGATANEMGAGRVNALAAVNAAG